MDNRTAKASATMAQLQQMRRVETVRKQRQNEGQRDAWLVYNCIACKNSWNRPIFERRNVREVEAPLMNDLLGNDPDYVRRLAFDVEDLRRKSERIVEFPGVDVRKEALNRRCRRWTCLSCD
jgi:hypothetical protein